MPATVESGAVERPSPASTLVRLPGGTFRMGPPARPIRATARARARRRLSPFGIDAYAVSNDRFEAFVSRPAS